MQPLVLVLLGSESLALLGVCASFWFGKGLEIQEGEVHVG